ncbi:MAG: hypothetical protein R6U36_11265 [Candidatus Fermentibacteraceae bacterium]
MFYSEKCLQEATSNLNQSAQVQAKVLRECLDEEHEYLAQNYLAQNDGQITKIEVAISEQSPSGKEEITYRLGLDSPNAMEMLQEGDQGEGIEEYCIVRGGSLYANHRFSADFSYFIRLYKIVMARLIDIRIQCDTSGIDR